MLPTDVREALDRGGSAPLRQAIKGSQENRIGLRLCIVEVLEDIARDLNFGALLVLVEEAMVVPEILKQAIAIFDKREWVAGMALIAQTTMESKKIFDDTHTRVFTNRPCLQTYRCPIWVGMDAPSDAVNKAARHTDSFANGNLCDADFGFPPPIQLPSEAAANVRAIAGRIREWLDSIMDSDGTFGYIEEVQDIDPNLIPHIAELIEKRRHRQFRIFGQQRNGTR